ncbi:unnamed protein product [Amaranthus hypochondriacus]
MSLSFSPISYLPLPNLTYVQKSPKTLVSVSFHPQTLTFFCCSHGRNPRKPNNKISDAELASDFAAEVHRLNTQSKERENAMKRIARYTFGMEGTDPIIGFPSSASFIMRSTKQQKYQNLYYCFYIK